MGSIIGILVLIGLGYSNSTRAKLKGKNGLLWAFITIISYILAQAVGLYVVVSFFCRDIVDMSVFSGKINDIQAASKQFNEQLETALLANPLRELTVLLFGLGGFLLVRYIIDSKPDKKEPEVHWMDKMGQQ